MNSKIRKSIKSISNFLGAVLSNFIANIVSLMRICLLSKVLVAIQSKKCRRLKHSNDCCVLANGPSLKSALESGSVRFAGNDVFCVNLFCDSDYFWIIKPRFYFLVDGAFFSKPKDERVELQLSRLKTALNRVDWELYLVISAGGIKGGILNEITNINVHIIKMNSTTVEGSKWFCHLIYRLRMGMPRCQTVTNFALCAAINMGYNNVYLYGADHTWTRDLFVDENNVVCYGDRHVYNKNLTVIKKEENFALILDAFSNMFKSHYKIEEYSKKVGVKIWNCSNDSFVDAYERLK